MKKLLLVILFLTGNSFAQRFSSGQSFPSLTNSGSNVGIGSTSPASTLDVNGSVRASSGTFGTNSTSAVTISTNGAVSSTKSCVSGFTRVSPNFCLDTNGSRELLISSAPTATPMGFDTLNSTTLNAAQAKAALLVVHIDYTQDAVASATLLNLFIRQTGGGASANEQAACARAANLTALERAVDDSECWVILDANYDFDFSCNMNDVEAGRACDIDLAGYMD